MELVVDASVLFAAIIGKGKTQDLFFEDKLKLVATSYLVKEFDNNIVVIAKLCGISEQKVVESFEILKERIDILPVVKFPLDITKRAERLAPHSKDTSYFELALFLGCGIWSRDKDFKKQNEVKVYNTTELVDMFLKH